MSYARRATIWAIAYVLICGAIPTGLLVWQYESAYTYATLYGHFFLYPLIFGWIPVFIVARTFHRIVGTLNPNRGAKSFWIGVAGISMLALGLELQSVNIAPWEVKPERLAALGFDDHFSGKKHTEVEKEAYQRAMNREVSLLANWSIVRYAYFVSLVVQVAALLAVFFSAGALMAYRIRLEMLNSDPILPKWFRGSLSLLSSAVAVCLLYTFARLAFTAEKAAFFPYVSNETSAWVIIGLFIIAITFLAACLWLWVGKYLQPILSLVFGGVSAVVVWKYPEVLAASFGQRAGLLGWLTIAVGVTCVIWLWYAFGPSIENILEEDAADQLEKPVG